MTCGSVEDCCLEKNTNHCSPVVLMLVTIYYNCMFVVRMLYRIAGILLRSALTCVTEIIHGFNFDESGPSHMNTPYKSIRIQFLRIALEGRP